MTRVAEVRKNRQAKVPVGVVNKPTEQELQKLVRERMMQTQDALTWEERKLLSNIRLLGAEEVAYLLAYTGLRVSRKVATPAPRHLRLVQPVEVTA